MRNATPRMMAVIGLLALTQAQAAVVTGQAICGKDCQVQLYANAWRR